LQSVQEGKCSKTVEEDVEKEVITRYLKQNGGKIREGGHRGGTN